jgi:ssDNA-binding Zn-finger/Zn-ribbon topoisomerase 1
LTAHSLKGLGFDDVIIVNAINNKYGFPSQLEDDPVLKLVTTEDNGIKFAEERRLFYVALTRTKNRVFIVAPENRPSPFIIEIQENFDNIYLMGNLNNEVINLKDFEYRCPECGYPLKYLTNKEYGLPLYHCTNEPEICSFLTNIGKSNGKIHKCSKCIDGYMIVKRNNEGDYFFGCTNYNSTKKTGCMNTEKIQKENNIIEIKSDKIFDDQESVEFKNKKTSNVFVDLYDKVTIENIKSLKILTISILPVEIEYHPVFKIGAKSYLQQDEYEQKTIYYSNFELDKTISENSPLAEAILGKKMGDNFKYNAPDGWIEGKIVNIEKYKKAT